MKLEMTTDFLELIYPGSYGTNIGNLLEDVTDESVDDFFRLCSTVWYGFN